MVKIAVLVDIQMSGDVHKPHKRSSGFAHFCSHFCSKHNIFGAFFLQKEMNDKLQRATGWIEILGFCREDSASVHGVHAP